MSITRREFLTHSALSALGLLSLPSIATAALSRPFGNNTSDALPGGDYAPFKLPELPYKLDALEPYIDAQTMTIHYTKHHQAYITKLNAAVEQLPALKDLTLEQMITGIDHMPDSVRQTVRNNGGGHWNHTFFWHIITDKKNTTPSDKLLTAINNKWGSVDAFKTAFEKSATSVFGSGWAWLVKLPDGTLSIITTPNQDNPRMDIAEVKGFPIIAIDVWEHAYYLKYQNRRADYIKAYWNVLNWETASTLYNG